MQNRIRAHVQSHGLAWLDLLLVIAAAAFLFHAGLMMKLDLLPEKYAHLALSQFAAHLVVKVRVLNGNQETALRIGFAIAVAFAG